MKAIVVTDQTAGTAEMKLVERPEPQAAINDVVVQVHAAGFVNTELEWPSTWADRAFRDRTPSILGHELAGADRLTAPWCRSQARAPLSVFKPNVMT
jgi:NADPH:quinone reductase-like Zn-dependent oxidoreductase